MKLIWNDLLHANFRCGRMCGDRAEHLAVNCTMPSCCARMCTRMWRWQNRFELCLPGALMYHASGFFVSW